MASLPEPLNQVLLSAARAGDLNRMKECAERLDRGEGLVATYSKHKGPLGLTALHYAAKEGRTQICKYLIEVVGLHINIQDWHGETVLNHSIMGRNHPTVAYLIRQGADLNLANHRGYAALHTATQEEGIKETLRLLISSGADIEAQSQSGTPLQCAASRGKKEAVKILLDNKANPNATTCHVFTPLLAAIIAESHECINMLLKAGADPNVGGDGVTPLAMAASKGDNEAIKCLLKAGANPNVTNFEGMTPLEISALNHNHEGVNILLPKTSPIPSIPDWTLRGIINVVHSEEARNQRVRNRIDCFMESKAKGAEAVKRKDYHVAMFWYTRAITCTSREATLFSNRSLCWARMNNGTRAFNDVEACIALKPDWSKAHYKKGVACEMLKDFRGAAEAYAFALKLEPGNEEIQTALRNVEALERLRDVVEGQFGFQVVDAGVF